MPLIHTVTNQPVSKEQAAHLKEACARAITLIPGKSERWLMISIEDEKTLYFAGSDAPCALAEVQIYGTAADEVLDRLTAALTEILAKELSVSPDRIYVKYEFVSHWGWNGANF